MITNNGDIFVYLKEIPLRKDHASAFTEATIHNQKYTSIKACICCNIEASIPYKQFLYSDNSDKTILHLLRNNNMWLKWNKFSTHRESSIGFINIFNPNITHQIVVCSRIELALCSIPLSLEETRKFLDLLAKRKEKQRLS